MRQRGSALPVIDGAAAAAAKQQRSVTAFWHSATTTDAAPSERVVLLPGGVAATTADDADAAAGRLDPMIGGGGTVASSISTNTLGSFDPAIMESAPPSVCTINTVKGHPGDLEFFEDLITEPVLVLGVDISHLSAASQFTVCAAGLFAFSLLYGYLQELLSVELCSRQLGLFLAMTQFAGYTVLAYFMHQFVYSRQQSFIHKKNKQQQQQQAASAFESGNGGMIVTNSSNNLNSSTPSKTKQLFDAKHVPLALYLGLSLLRAVDLAMVRTCGRFWGLA